MAVVDVTSAPESPVPLVWTSIRGASMRSASVAWETSMGAGRLRRTGSSVGFTLTVTDLGPLAHTSTHPVKRPRQTAPH